MKRSFTTLISEVVTFTILHRSGYFNNHNPVNTLYFPSLTILSGFNSILINSVYSRDLRLTKFSKVHVLIVVVCVFGVFTFL